MVKLKPAKTSKNRRHIDTSSPFSIPLKDETLNLDYTAIPDGWYPTLVLIHKQPGDKIAFHGIRLSDGRVLSDKEYIVEIGRVGDIWPLLPGSSLDNWNKDMVGKDTANRAVLFLTESYLTHNPALRACTPGHSAPSLLMDGDPKWPPTAGLGALLRMTQLRLSGADKMRFEDHFKRPRAAARGQGEIRLRRMRSVEPLPAGVRQEYPLGVFDAPTDSTGTVVLSHDVCYFYDEDFPLYKPYLVQLKDKTGQRGSIGTISFLGVRLDNLKLVSNDKGQPYELDLRRTDYVWPKAPGSTLYDWSSGDANNYAILLLSQDYTFLFDTAGNLDNCTTQMVDDWWWRAGPINFSTDMLERVKHFTDEDFRTQVRAYFTSKRGAR